MLNTPFSQLVKSRRSIRKFQDKRVEREKIQECVEAARLAPSAENVQPWRFLIVDDEEIKTRLGKLAFHGIYSPTKWAVNAPAIVILLAKLDILANRIGKQIQGTNYYLIDIGIAGEHFVLQAQELGLGTCWIGWFNERGVRKALKIPKKYKIVQLMVLGYPLKTDLKIKNKFEKCRGQYTQKFVLSLINIKV